MIGGDLLISAALILAVFGGFIAAAWAVLLLFTAIIKILCWMEGI